MNICPVCGFFMDNPAKDFHICVCCGTEFDYDDAGRSHEELRRIWVRHGSRWWGPVSMKPEGWNPQEQVKRVQI